MEFLIFPLIMLYLFLVRENPAMSPAIIILIVGFALMSQEKRKNILLARTILRKKNQKETTVMKETAKRFIGERCIVYFIGGTQSVGVIKEVNDTAIVINVKGTDEILNLDFVARIRQYPKDKKGKEKKVVLD